jgi:glycosyltransferase involved in cell wall biosynthesis
VLQICRWHEVWVITRANNQESIEKALATRPLPNVHWVYFDLPHWARFWKEGARGLRAYYYLWQLGAYFVARRLHREVGFDLVHHVTFVNYWMPSFVSLLPVPFLWGPVGGGESAPRAFWRCFGFRGKLYEILRDLARSLGQFDPFVRLTARRAAFTFATTHETETRVRQIGCRRVGVLFGIGLPAEEIQRLGDIPTRQANPFRLLSLGWLLHWKGFELALRSFALFNRRFPNSEYWIIGDGPERARLERLARELGVASKVSFWGLLPRFEVLDKLAQCDALVHPSLHDSGGWVCLEAMAAGRPVICLDLAGPGFQVTDDTGIKVPATSPQEVVSDLAAAMLRLAHDPALRIRLGQAGRQRVAAQFDWHQKGIFMAKVYEAVKASEVGQFT